MKGRQLCPEPTTAASSPFTSHPYHSSGSHSLMLQISNLTPINQILMPSFAGLRLFLYTEVSPEKKQGFEYGVFLFNFKFVIGKSYSVQSVVKFKLSALFNRNYYALAKEAIFGLGCHYFNTPNTIENLSRQISDQLSFCGINFIRNPRVKVSHLPIPVFVIDILMVPKEDTGDPGDVTFIRKRSEIVNYVTNQTLQEKRMISHRDGLLNELESKAIVHVYLKNLELQEDDIDADELKLLVDELRGWSVYEFELGSAEISNPNPIFQVKVPPLLRFVDIDQYLGESDDPCCICLEEFSNDCEGVVQIAQMVRCKHVYHTHCVSNWIQTNPSCPICRSCSQTILI